VNPKVGVVVVNWNKSADVIRLLDSLADLDYDNHEVFVVDNASTDDSVERIKAHPLGVNLLVNEENQGGTGGFNSGIRFALQTTPCKYVWLLDNDATVTPGALKAMVEVMEEDFGIGLAGSRILNAQDPDFVVETGALFDWTVGTVRPVDRNLPKQQASSARFVSVDYVAVCSALARVSALVDVGLMDERYFLFWDDMDWGAAFRQHGYRVVAVPASEILHAPFTEYRSALVDNYYGVRNQLLTFSRFRCFAGSTGGLFNICRRMMKEGLLMLLTGKQGGPLMFQGIVDFLLGRWGKCPWGMKPGPNREGKPVLEPGLKEKVLLVPTTGVAETADVAGALQTMGIENIDLLVPSDRKELFASIRNVTPVEIDYLKQNQLWESARCFGRILRCRYDLAVTTSNGKISPFTFAVRRSACFDADTGHLFQTREALPQIWKVIFAAGFGEVLGLFLFVIVWLRGYSLVRRTA